jgi:hypothetical protein
MFVFKNKYPQEFLDRLAKELSIEWTEVTARTVDRDSFSASPLPPPSGILFYTDHVFSDKRPNNEDNQK